MAEYPNLLAEAKKDPSINWDTSETYFIRLGVMPQIYERMQLFLYYRTTGPVVRAIDSQQKCLLRVF